MRNLKTTGVKNNHLNMPPRYICLPMPNILKGHRKQNDSHVNNNGHRKIISSAVSISSEKEADRKFSVVMVGCGSVGIENYEIIKIANKFRKVVHHFEICL